MRIAFDCYGTLLGNYEDKVLRFYRWLEKQGHEMIIWSSLWCYVDEVKKRHGINGIGSAKLSKFDIEDENEHYDIAIDDDVYHSQHLAAKKVILVKDIPEEEEKFHHLIGG